MKEKEQKIITYVGMWLAAIAGSSIALIYIITGYLLDWGPGGGMTGPLWRVLLVGIPSALAGAYVGELVVRIIAKKMFGTQGNTGKAFVVVFAGSLAGILVGWQLAAILGKVTGAIEGLDWDEVLINSPIFSTFYAIPISLSAGILYMGFVYVYLRNRKT